MGNYVTIYLASEDYGKHLLYENQTLPYIVELYNLSVNTTSQDLLRIFKKIHPDPLYLKWCDNSTCLLIFDSPVCGNGFCFNFSFRFLFRCVSAKQTLLLKFENMEIRPITEASIMGCMIVSRNNLEPASRRYPPPTLH